jgi:DNA-directed RNA polymerase sigma subunit (sigma70/sigma32)
MGELIIDDDLPQPDEHATLTLRAADIRFFLDTLPPRERSILRARFGLDGNEPRTLDQIAHIEGVTRERVRQIEKRALALLHVPRLEHYLRDCSSRPAWPYPRSMSTRTVPTTVTTSSTRRISGIALAFYSAGG